MPVELRENRYGKSSVRLATVRRAHDRHDFTDVTVDVAVEGDFVAAHLEGDNAAVLPTDTMRGTVYALARVAPVGEIEDFGLRLAARFLEAAPAVHRAHVHLVERAWDRVSVAGAEHPHTFTPAPGGLRTATVTSGRDGTEEVVGGVTGWRLLKTTGSGFEGFLRDEYTTLDETTDRIMATTVTGQWRYRDREVDFAKAAQEVRQVALEVFATTYSPSVQHTLYAMGEAVLTARPDIVEISFSLPNQHHFLVDLSPYGLDNPGEVYVSANEPFGLIEGTVVRR